MLRGTSHFRWNLAFASVAALALCASLALTSPTFADDQSTSTSADGGSSAGAGAAGANASAGMGSDTGTQSTSNDNGGSASANTGAGAGASQGDGNSGTAAGANTNANAAVNADGTSLTANASADANATGLSHADDSLGITDSNSKAEAQAKNGDAPSAKTKAGSDTWALAVGGKNRSANAVAKGKNEVVQTKNGPHKTITIAFSEDGNYSIAIATNSRATAYSSTYGKGLALTADGLFAEARTYAQAFATAGKHDAYASASSTAFGLGGNEYGVSAAASASHANARVSIQVTRARNGREGNDLLCTVNVDLKSFKKLSPSQRNRVLHCACAETTKVKFGEPIKNNACNVTASLKGGTLRLEKRN